MLEMGESDPESGWYASVKYISEGKTEYVPVKDISEFGADGVAGTPFRPKKLIDF